MSNLFPFHGHSVESQQDGMITIEETCQKHAELGFKHVLSTNHGTQGSNLKLFETASKYGLKAISGIEFYFIQDKFKEVSEKNSVSTTGLPFKDSKTFHLTVIVLNEIGQQNMNKLIYLSNLKPKDEIKVDGLYGYHQRVPRITEKQLFQLQEGLAIFTGCRLSIFNQYIQAGLFEKATELLLQFKNNLENFFVELHIAHNEIEEKLFYWLLKFAEKHNIPYFPANDYHYLNKGELKYWNMAGAFRRRLTIKTADPIINDDFYIKSEKEILDRVSSLTNDDNATVKKVLNYFDLLDDKITYKWDKIKVDKINFPNAEKDLYNKLANSLYEKFGSADKIPLKYKQRLREEFEVAKYTGNCSYYLLIEDLIEKCVNKKLPNISGQIPVGRGSASSLLMLYLLNVTMVDPLEYNLLAERCSNRQRIKEADVDLDFSKEDVEIIKEHYLYKKYGKDCVANICNYGYYKLSSSIKAVLRYLDIPVVSQNRINKLIKERFVEYKYSQDENDETNNETLEPSIENVSKLNDFEKIFTENGVDNYGEVLDYCKHIEGTVEKLSVHASGLLISNKPIYKDYPTIRVKNTICSAFDMEDLSKMNSLKLDLLSVNTYARIQETIETYNLHY